MQQQFHAVSPAAIATSREGKLATREEEKNKSMMLPKSPPPIAKASVRVWSSCSRSEAGAHSKTLRSHQAHLETQSKAQLRDQTTEIPAHRSGSGPVDLDLYDFSLDNLCLLPVKRTQHPYNCFSKRKNIPNSITVF